jgi:hypothetical protein
MKFQPPRALGVRAVLQARAALTGVPSSSVLNVGALASSVTVWVIGWQFALATNSCTLNAKHNVFARK